MIQNRLGAVALGLLLAGEAMAGPTYTLLNFDDLAGWAKDDHATALTVFTDTCGDMKDPEWAGLCAFAKSAPDARAFFETFFQPVLIEDGEPMLFTGYFEPELRGSKTQIGPFQYPIYSLPSDHKVGQPYLSRQEIEETAALSDRGLEIAWLADPVDLFFLQVQGSGRIRLPDGGGMRVGYGGKNGREYSSIGQELVRRGTYESHQVSAQVIRNWVRDNPEEGRELLWVNKSYVFFREVNQILEGRANLHPSDVLVHVPVRPIVPELLHQFSGKLLSVRVRQQTDKVLEFFVTVLDVALLELVVNVFDHHLSESCGPLSSLQSTVQASTKSSVIGVKVGCAALNLHSTDPLKGKLRILVVGAGTDDCRVCNDGGLNSLR